jgi:hypothetical protein
MRESSRSPPTVLFTLRLWVEPLDETRDEWRGAVKNLTTGEVRYFRRWEEIAVLVSGMLPDNNKR